VAGGRGRHVENDGTDLTVLTAAAERGDQAAWNEIVDRYTPLLVAVIMRHPLPAPDREDVAQTVWLRLIEHLGELRGPRALPTWIISTARREALRTAAARKPVRPRDPHDAVRSCRSADEDFTDVVPALSERSAALLEALGTLSAQQRELLMILAENPRVPDAEISRRIGIPAGAIGPARACALEQIRRSPSMRTLATVGASSSEGPWS
jgi:RNA polymerase sigma factor (sigma-70 family)